MGFSLTQNTVTFLILGPEPMVLSISESRRYRFPSLRAIRRPRAEAVFSWVTGFLWWRWKQKWGYTELYQLRSLENGNNVN